MQSLSSKVAVVTGASRNGGRAIALALGEAGATVYVTGRSVRGASTTNAPAATIEDTAEQVTARGGLGIPVQVDHTNDLQVEKLFARVQHQQGRLDILVNNAWGGYEMQEGFWNHVPFWELPLCQWDLMLNAGLRSHMFASRCAVPLMLPQHCGLIINTTTGIHPLGQHHGHLFYDTVKVAINRMSSGMAEHCRPHGIAVIALSLGNEHLFMRTWEIDPETQEQEMLHTFSPGYVGRAVAALATDPNVIAKAGYMPFHDVPSVAREYGFTDVDGRQP